MFGYAITLTTSSHAYYSIYGIIRPRDRTGGKRVCIGPIRAPLPGHVIDLDQSEYTHASRDQGPVSFLQSHSHSTAAGVVLRFLVSCTSFRIHVISLYNVPDVGQMYTLFRVQMYILLGRFA